ncbi:release factor glutamine methyltransferase [Mycolicibacterium madagascariense]|uniref:Release factor glutamine methyltransferase n=1 Tax=Mycolicibacterium madagascariense TaxID=212765 RepID=A0A7I7XKK7_9MYCO|nr:peptide chain release factor N(5)-glutamine methyltransferase [Mycolicibacterium madagascariense]MCV7011576.1 peptide chain release factor N(5)-glutamine methyltransferase [Mycolicibacterium madagascariense]BBZ29761.1 release factor glutamine methyltransferase [Mycolicibacterium madagascariense]
MTRLRRAIDEAAGTLEQAGIDSAHVDAELLAAHAAGLDRGLLRFHEPDEPFYVHYRDLVEARSRRIPLQHLTESAAFGPLLLHVGPGVFIPRPETESLLEWALRQRLSPKPTIVDLCTGSGALAAALAAARHAAHVVAVEDSAEALRYARRNCAGLDVELVEADVTTPGLLSGYDGTVDLLVANPPYIPDGAVLDPEVADHDPAHALFGGPDGMRVIGPIVAIAARLLRSGGAVAVEHDDDTAASTVALFEESSAFAEVTSRRDLAGRPRFVTAMRKARDDGREWVANYGGVHT